MVGKVDRAEAMTVVGKCRDTTEDTTTWMPHVDTIPDNDLTLA